jgi:hypothetical protein
MEIHTAHPAYGAERITRELKRQGFEIGRRLVSRLTSRIQPGALDLMPYERRCLATWDDRIAKSDKPR